jgi:L-amino acid N-acyltransferase YncA
MSTPAVSAEKIQIRRAETGDAEAVWRMFRDVVEEGDAFLSDESIQEEEALAMWLGPGITTFVACGGDGAIAGAYCLKRNHYGRGSHVANATYMISRENRSRGIGRLLGEHSLRVAKELGFAAMQFDCVVSTNEASVALWKKLGFAIVGTLPHAFRHSRLGLVDAYVMHKFL